MWQKLRVFVQIDTNLMSVEISFITMNGFADIVMSRIISF